MIGLTWFIYVYLYKRPRGRLQVVWHNGAEVRS